MDNADAHPAALHHVTHDPERRAFWHARYSAGAAWSGHVNPALAEVAGALPPGAALDLGCGEGGDVLWLAEHGWSATGIDAAAPALDRARAEAARRELSDRAAFIEADLETWSPARRWDLVTCHYLHEAPALREAVLAVAASAVAPGGTLVVVGHHPDEPQALQGPHRDTRFTAEQVAAALRLDDAWTVSATMRPRTAVRDGREVERWDAVMVAHAPVRTAAPEQPVPASLEMRTEQSAHLEGRAVMDGNATDTRRYTYEQIRAKEIARGASEDEAAKVAADTVDKVMAEKGLKD